MTILVTGATGNVGRLVVDHLVAAGASDVRALTVNPTKTALPAQVEVVRGYVGRPQDAPTGMVRDAYPDPPRGLAPVRRSQPAADSSAARAEAATAQTFRRDRRPVALVEFVIGPT